MSTAADIAIIGMACRVPGANSPSEFWALLRDGREARTSLSEEDLRAAGVPDSLLAHPDYVRAGMFLPQMENFDPAFFGLSPLDGRVMDPQHRHFLECAWEALEDAGCDPSRTSGAIGVFAGSGHNAYFASHVLTQPSLLNESGYFLLRHTGNDKDFLATRVSYCFNLKGPSVNVQTACSTSLVAAHFAVQSLLNGECDIALAGGVTIELPHRHGYLYKNNEILSRDGHCRPYDISAGGTVFGSGVGVVVLKRLADAIADNDQVYAVIKGSAVNNDGADKVSYLAPSVEGQAAAVQEALAIAGIAPETVSYVEGHGTGTQLGDPIEVTALSLAYASPAGRQFCALGSVKSNIGHLDTAAGVASLIKVALAMRHRRLPATLHYDAPNPGINFAASPFFVVDSFREWHAHGPRRAGVSSVGVGGTNAHVVLEEAPARRPGVAGQRPQLLVLSARSDAALLRGRDRLARWLEDHATVNPDTAYLDDCAYTLAVGRRAFRKRGFVVTTNIGEAVAALDGNVQIPFIAAEAPPATRNVAFMFAGGGAQHPCMGQELYRTEPVYRQAVDECLQHLTHFIDFDLRPLLYPDDDIQRSVAAGILERPSRTLPALFVTQYAQARLWQSWGVKPAALIGHSMGENTAACLAGVMSLRDALGLVALRGKLFESVAPGSMLSVELDEVALRPLLGAELSLAAVNAPGLSVASGPATALAALERQLGDQQIANRRVRIEVAAHSAMLEPILEPFASYLRSIRLQAPTIPFVSNLTGDWIRDDEATSPDYWVKHLRHTVRFAEGVGRLLEGERYVLLEVGPGRTLASLANAHQAKGSGHAVITSMPPADEHGASLPHMLEALGRVWSAGADLDWTAFYAGQGRSKVSLPTYAFDHVRCWLDQASADAQPVERPPSGTRSDLLHQPVWLRSSPPPAGDLHQIRVLVFAGDNALNAAVIKRLMDAGAEVRVVRALAARQQLPASHTVEIGRADDYVHLVEALDSAAWAPTHVLHLLALDTPAGANREALAEGSVLVFDSLLHLAQATGASGWQDVRWVVATPSTFQVGAEPIWSPLPALALGPVQVMPREFPGWRCALVDIDATPGLVDIDAQAATLVAELNEPFADGPVSVVALRRTGRFIRRFVPCHSVDQKGATTAAVVRGGVYLVTGGTGALGLVAASTLADQNAITLVLLARRELPAREYWERLIATNAPEASVLTALMALEARGTTVVLAVGDVSDAKAMTALRARIEKEHGPVRGIVHTAGVIDDAPLLAKDAHGWQAVLAPKVEGTLVLGDVFATPALDFAVLYSSTSALAGLPGQVDYCAANAFLDSYAHWRQDQGIPVVAVNWPVWRGSGMAADTHRHPRLPAGRPVDHPLLERCTASTQESVEFACLVSAARHWVISEHRIKDGPALLPGAAFLEIARAAWCEASGTAGAVEMSDVSFDYPFIVADDQPRIMYVSVERTKDSRSGRVIVSSGEAQGRVEHATCRVMQGTTLARRVDLEGIGRRCASGRQLFADEEHHPFLEFGDRWSSLRSIDFGAGEALTRLELDERYRDDLQQFAMHPALVDMAAAGAQVIIEGYRPKEEFYVPIGCRRLVFNGVFPPRAISHVVAKPQLDRDLVTFDVSVCDDAGQVFLAIEGFALRRLTGAAAFRNETRQSRAPGLTGRALELGIDPSAGAVALLSIVSRQRGPQTVVSPQPVHDMLSALLAAVMPDAPSKQAARPVVDVAPLVAIEDAIRQCDAVHDVVVQCFEDAGVPRFVAYFVPDHDSFTTISEVRRFMRAALPADRLPQQLVELDDIPRREDGTPDRDALRDPLAPEDKHVAPRTATEKAIARIWRDALGVERVGRTDNFFDLGGHSLLSVRVLIQMSKRLGVRLDQASMALGTLEQVAKYIDARAKDSVEGGQ